MGVFVMRLVRIVRIVVAALAATVPVHQASAAMLAAPITSAIGQLQEWNLISFGNYTGGNEVEGRVFVGGNMSANSQFNFKYTTPSPNGTAAVTVVGNTSGSKIDYRGGDLTVGGNQTASTLEINGSQNKVWVGGTNSSSTANGAVITTGLATSNPDFTNTLNAQKASLVNTMTNLSTNLKNLAATSNGVLDTSYNKLQYTAGSGVNVLNLTIDQLKNWSQNYIDIVSPNGSTTIINVTCAAYAGNCGTVDRNYNSTSSAVNTLWNFYDATSLTLGNWQGSVLAVNADFTKNTSGAISGTMVGKTTANYAEVHSYSFQGDLSSVSSTVSATPEPSTWMMLMLGFGIIGAAMRRRGQRTLILQAA